MFVAGFAALVAAMIVTAVADVVTAAMVSGVFTVVNTALLTMLHRKTREVRAEQVTLRNVITAPRRLLFDQDGKPIGTVLDLHGTDGGWDTWLQHSRRIDDSPQSES